MSTMEYLASLYPSLQDRKPIPILYAPTAHALAVIPWLLPKKGRVFATFPLMLALALMRPCYTSASPMDNYNAGSHFFSAVFVYLDFLILTPPEEEEPRFVGSSKVLAIGNKSAAEAERSRGIGLSDNISLWKRFTLALRLSFYGRGIGWNWQVKNVPACTDAHFEKWAYVRRRLLLAIYGFAMKSLTVYLLGMAFNLEGRAESQTQQSIFVVALGWLATVYAWYGLNTFYNLCAAITVAVGMFDQWEWPPLNGPIKELWSVRQAWSVVWHQLTRRMLNQPAVRLSRLLGLRKGTLSARYVQLFATFAMSMLLHEWDIFNAARRDIGEFRFFMLQPCVITLEDFVQYCWRSYTGRSKNDKLTSFEKVIGWTWTILWFSYSIPPFAKGLVYTRIIGYDAEGILRLGQQHAEHFISL